MRTLRAPALLFAATLLAAACAVDAPTDPAARASEGASFDGAGALGSGAKSDTTVTTTDGVGYIGTGAHEDSTAVASDGGGYLGSGT